MPVARDTFRFAFAMPTKRLHEKPPLFIVGSRSLAADAVAVRVKSVDVRTDHLHRSRHVRGPVTAATGTVNI
jgi:hypothetical protein